MGIFRFFAGFYHPPHTLFVADVAGIDAYFIDAVFGGKQRKPVVEMDIRHKRHVRVFFQKRNACRAGFIRHGKAHNFTAGLFKL